MLEIVDNPIKEERAIRSAAAVVGGFNVDGDPPGWPSAMTLIW